VVFVRTRAVSLLLACALSSCASEPPPEDRRVSQEDRARAAEGARIVGDLLEEQDLDRAAEVSDQVMEQDPFSPESNLAAARARAAVAVRDQDPRLYQEAVRRADFACEADPLDPKAFFVRGKLQFDRQYYTRAAIDFERVIELDPSHHDALLMKAWAHRALRQPKAEKAAWHALVEAHPEDAQANYRLALILMEGTPEEVTEGEQLLARAAELDPRDDLVLHELARLKSGADEHAEAEALLRRALEAAAGKPGREADLLFNLGAAVQAQGRHEEARDLYERCLEIRHDHARALGNLGLVLLELGQQKEAIRRLRQARDLEPSRKVRASIEKLLEDLKSAESSEPGEPDEETDSTTESSDQSP